MKDATLAQGNQVFNLILQHGIPAAQLQSVIESGLLTDLLTGNVTGVDRNDFRVMLGFVPWGKISLVEIKLSDSNWEECASEREGCLGTIAWEAVGTAKSGKFQIGIKCCANEDCKAGALHEANHMAHNG